MPAPRGLRIRRLTVRGHSLRSGAGAAAFPPALPPENAGVTRRAVLTCAAALCGAGCERNQVERDPHEAIQAAHDFVKVRLVSPGTAAFGGDADTVVDELGAGRYRVRGLVDYTGVDGSTMRVSFTCVVSVANNRWSLDEMDLH